MELDIIKSQTTWNDAVGGINSNFAKIKAAFTTVGTGGGGGLNEDELRLFLEQNGYTTENWVKLQKYLTAESADLFFARKEWVEQQIEGIDLSPYAKSTDVANTYATISALNTLEGKHNTLRSEFDALNNLLSSDTTDYINTWNEVVAFLDGYKDESDLATILSGMNADISSRLLTSTFESWKADTYTPLANLVANHTTRLNGIDTSITNINTRLDGVDKTIEDHIAEFIAFRANFEISDDLILVRKNFASTEEVSAKGINQGTGGGGGSSFSRLDAWADYDSNKAGYVLSALLGYDLHSRVTVLENKEVDLSNYYTKEQTDNRISAAISKIDFTPYAKVNDVAKTYATIAALNLIDGRVGNLEKAGYATTGYVDAAISGIDFSPYATTEELNEAIEGIDLTPFAKSADVALTYATKNELTASINGLNISQYAKSSDVEATYATKEALTSAINGLNISQYATTAALDKAISDLNISQYAKSTDVASTYATIAALSGLTDLHNNLRSEFDALNSLLNDDTAGVIDTWNEVVDFINEYSGSDDLETILAGMNKNIDLRLLASDFNAWVANTYTPLAYRVGVAEENIGKNATAIANNKSDIDKLLGWFKIDSDGNVYTEHNFYSTQQISAKGLNAGGGSGSSYNRLDAWTDYDSNKAGYVLSASLGYGLKVAIDELNGYDLDNRVRSIENSYVSKDAGGVVNGGLIVSSLAVSGGSSSQFLKADGSLDSTSYLPTSGGTIESTITTPLTILTTTEYSTIRLHSTAGYRTFGMNGSGDLFVSDMNGWNKEYIIVNLGNIGDYAITPSTIGSQSVAYASNAGSVAWGNVSGKPSVAIQQDVNNFIHNSNEFTFVPNEYNDVLWLNYRTTGGTNGNIVSYIFGNGKGGKLAEISNGQFSGNATSATKLATARTIWGQSFDGTGNVSGDLHLSVSDIYWHSDKANYCIESVVSPDAAPSLKIAHYGGIGFHTGRVSRMYISYSGNVGIGITSPSYKLHVDGDVALTGELKFIGGYSIQSYNSTALSINPQGNDILLNQNGYGNVGIGTPSPSYKLDVIGDIRATESITIGGATLSWENGALKVNTSFYSEKEISAKGLSTGGGSGASYNRLDAWGDYDSSKAGYVLSAYLGDDLNTRLSSLSGVVDTHTSRLSSLENAGYITSSALSGYLPTSGGTLSRSGRDVLTIDTSDSFGPMYQISVKGKITGLIGHIPSESIGDYGLFISNEDANTALLLASDRELYFSLDAVRLTKDYTLIHSGNIGSQNVWYANRAGGIQGSTSSINFARGHNRLEMINDSSGSIGDFVSAYQSGISVITEYVGWQMTSYGGVTENPYFRSLEDTGRWKPWRQLAFLDDNVASATKLATPRTIWGQSFDGTKNIDGDFKCGYIDIQYSDEINRYGGNLYLQHRGGVGTTGSGTGGTATGNILMCANGGNVAIGTADPQYKLHVEGSGYFSGALTANGGLTVNGILTVGGASIHPANGTPYFQLYQNSKYWYWQADNNYTYIGGTMSKALRIDQDGNTLIRGSLGVTGDATANRLVVGTDGISCNGPATFNDFIYGSSITPRTDNYYVLGNNNYKWYAVTAYNVNVHDAITIEAGKELRFKDNNGEVHTLKYDSTKQAFVFDGNVNATGEISAKKLNA